MLHRFSLCVAAAVTIAVCIASPTALAQQDNEAYASVAVQERRHLSTHELTLFGGVLPLDAFKKGFTLGGAYTLQLSGLWAWEVLNVEYSFPSETSLRDDLDALEVGPTPFEIAERMVTSSVVFKPIYWKGAWLNRSLVYGEILFSLGGGYGWFTRSGQIAADVGLGLRLYLSRLFSVRFDIRHYGFFRDSVFKSLDIHQELWTAVGFSLSL